MSKWEKPEPPPVEHPEFTPNDVNEKGMTDDQRYYITLVRQSLKLAYRRTPWNQAVVLQTKRHYMPDVLAALMLVADDAARLRTWVRVGYVEDGKRVMVGHGEAFPEGKQPWGPAPIATCECGGPLNADGNCTRVGSGAPDDGCANAQHAAAEWRAEHQGEFSPPINPE